MTKNREVPMLVTIQCTRDLNFMFLGFAFFTWESYQNRNQYITLLYVLPVVVNLDMYSTLVSSLSFMGAKTDVPKLSHFIDPISLYIRAGMIP